LRRAPERAYAGRARSAGYDCRKLARRARSGRYAACDHRSSQSCVRRCGQRSRHPTPAGRERRHGVTEFARGVRESDYERDDALGQDYPRQGNKARVVRSRESVREDDLNFLKYCGAALVGTLMLNPAGAQDFPTRPIKVVIAFPAGGPTDFVGRLLADKLKNDLGQTVIIENKAGASGTLGADYVAKSD